MAISRNKLIIDTDPGCDDVLAMLLAFTSSSEELDVAMISVTYGNVPLQSCAKNTVALFHVLEKELAWRKENGKPQGFPNLGINKPIVALGPEHPLEEEVLAADYFHGADGLHNVHGTYPHLTPGETWASIFTDNDSNFDPNTYSPYFVPSKTPSHKVILQILKENPPDTITIAAVGPLTNIAIAAAEDPETFLKVKELVVMGGAVHVEGNVTPVAEFNCFADSVAAARVYALTSPIPQSTMPRNSNSLARLPDYPKKLSRPLKLVLHPLDITTPHELGRDYFQDYLKDHVAAGSPLAIWCSHFLNGAYNKISQMQGTGLEPKLSLHDPLTIWYMLTRDDPKWKFSSKPEDIRVETSGQWTRGMHVIDRRLRDKPDTSLGVVLPDPPEDILSIEEVHGDVMEWISAYKGNRIHRVIGSPGEDLFREVLMKRIFG